MSSIDKLTSKELKALFDMPPERAIENLKRNGLHIGWHWQDTHALAHARSFTIAKMTALDMLSTTKKAIEQAMTDGTGYKGFENTIKPYLMQQGWWGESGDSEALLRPLARQGLRPRSTKTQTGVKVQLGSTRRLKIIYHTNRRTAIMTAKYERMKQAVATHPYWQYSAVMDKRTRPAHAAKHGAIYRHDDPFWQHSFPPNAFGCRCTVKAIGKHSIGDQEISKSTDGNDTGTLADNGFFPSPLASHLFDKLWYDKARQTLGQKHALRQIATDMASDVRVAGFLAWARLLQSSRQPQGKTYGLGILSNTALSKLASEHHRNIQELSPVVGMKDMVVAGKKYDRHISSGNALDMTALEKIIKDFGKPDYELWDSKNKTVLLIYHVSKNRVIKLAVKLDKSETLVVSGFYVNQRDVQGGIVGRFYQTIK
ncbi:MAG: phage minor head protein [Moraxella sp.]|nr:phage minor head protein [Moraxella sp.]